MKKKESTYFVSWIIPNEVPIRIGNSTVQSNLNGNDLVSYIIDAITFKVPGAVVLNIVKV